MSKYIYRFAALPPGFRLAGEFDKAAKRLKKKLIKLDSQKLSILGYDRIYFNNYLSQIDSILQRFSYILIWAVGASNSDELKDFVLIEDGGGIGFISLLARELGVGTIIYNDIDIYQKKDAQIIASALGLGADYYFSGDIKHLKKILPENKIDGLVSNDVIEHVYDIKEYLNELAGISIPPFNLVMASTANAANPLINRELTRKQLNFELKGQEKDANANPRDYCGSCEEARKKIIQHKFPQLKKLELQKIAVMTRGMIKKEIEDAAGKYISKQTLPKTINHPTNTCDPYTGNWCEHLMDTRKLKRFLEKRGLKTKIFGGYWNHHSRTNWKVPVANFINILIRLTKNKGLFFAPYFILLAKKD